MTLLINHADLILSRTYFLSPILHSQNRLRSWARKLFQEDRRLDSGRFGSEKQWFLPYIGPIQQCAPYHGRLIGNEAEHSHLVHEPFYIPANWRIRLEKDIDDVGCVFRLRIRLFPHGGCSVALTSTIQSKVGLPVKDFIAFGRSIVGDDVRQGQQMLRVHTCRNAFSAPSTRVIDKAFGHLCNALFTRPPNDVGSGAIVTYEPDHLFDGLSKTTPDLKHGTHDREMTGLLRLNPNYEKLKPAKGSEALGIYEDDWVLFNNRSLLFAQDTSGWPREGKLHWSRRRRTRLSWYFFKVVEFARIEKIALEYLACRFEKATLEMYQAKNLSFQFIKNLMKATFYDDALVTFAYDMGSMSECIYGQVQDLYAQLADAAGTAATRTRFEKATTEFLSQVKSWKPGIIDLLHLLKLVPLE